MLACIILIDVYSPFNCSFIKKKKWHALKFNAFSKQQANKYKSFALKIRVWLFTVNSEIFACIYYCSCLAIDTNVRLINNYFALSKSYQNFKMWLFIFANPIPSQLFIFANCIPSQQ